MVCKDYILKVPSRESFSPPHITLFPFLNVVEQKYKVDSNENTLNKNFNIILKNSTTIVN